MSDPEPSPIPAGPPGRHRPRLPLPRAPRPVLRRTPTGRSRGESSASRRRPALVVLGDLIVDVVVTPQGAVAPGTDTPGTVRFRVGGSAANAARAFARLGGHAVFVGAVGSDAWAARLVTALRVAGVAPRVVAVPASTARLAALISPGGERSFVTERAAADRLTAADLRPGWFRGIGALHLPAYSLLMEPLASAAVRAAELAHAAGGLVSVDLASRRPIMARGRSAARDRILATQPDVVFANASEATALVGRAASGRLLELAPLVVIKEGAHGCRVLWRPAGAPAVDDVRELTVATAPIRAADTTGAGDAFDAGFLHALLSELEPRGALGSGAALRRAAVAGHRSATRLLSEPRPELVL